MPMKAQMFAPDQSMISMLRPHFYLLAGSGRALLAAEARANQFFMLGELHGENQIPSLLADLWPTLWRDGYRHVAAEVSPWVAERLNRGAPPYTDGTVGLWTQSQATAVRAFAPSETDVIWGCDIEELQPNQLIADIAVRNRGNSALQRMAAIVAAGYDRSHARELLELARAAGGLKDRLSGGVSEWSSVRDTLEIEALRSDAATRFAASVAREDLMKRLLVRHLQSTRAGKVLLRFGRNHLHRGFDTRGVSTLGNFVAEYALSKGKSAFNIGAFAAGGSGRLMGQTFDADERGDEMTFAFLAQLISEPTIVDLRPLRPMLDQMSAAKRSPLEANLTYWANSYDLLLCYPSVTPLA
jgi:hypothetical protein